MLGIRPEFRIAVAFLASLLHNPSALARRPIDLGDDPDGVVISFQFDVYNRSSMFDVR